MRGLGVAVLLVVGLAAGAWLSFATDQPSSPARSASPVSAASPSVPGERQWTPFADPDLPPLPLEVSLSDQRLGSGAAADTIAVPTAWKRRAEKYTNEAMWHPYGYPRFTYFLRVEQVSSRHADAERLRDERIATLPEYFSRPEVLDEGEDTLWFSRENSGHLQHTVMGWVDVPPEDGEADLEVAVIGRERDLPGMRRLLESVSESARR
jgi:hypothetical protein